MIPLRDDVPVERAPIVNWTLIILNVLFFLVELSQAGNINHFVDVWAVNPHRFIAHTDAHQVGTIFTAMFMHGGWLHLIGNMWALVIFGDNVEDRMGHFRYLMFYLTCGVVAAIAQIATSASASVPSLGASGAIAGVMAAYLVYYPRGRVMTWIGIFILMLPAWFVVGEWFVIQLINGSASLVVSSASTTGQGIAWFAHVGGFIAGLVLAKLFEDPNYPQPMSIPGRLFERVR